MWLSSMDKSALVGAAGFSTILQGTLAGVSHTCVSGNRHIDLSSSSKSWSGQWTGSSSSWPLSENLWKILTWNHPWMRSLAEVQDSSREVSVHCWRKKKKKAKIKHTGECKRKTWHYLWFLSTQAMQLSTKKVLLGPGFFLWAKVRAHGWVPSLPVVWDAKRPFSPSPYAESWTVSYTLVFCYQLGE